MLKSALRLLVLLIFVGNIWGTDVTLNWSPNPEPYEAVCEDPTVNAIDLVGYKVYWGTSSRSYANSAAVGNVITYVVTGLQDGTYYFSITAYDACGNESTFSNEIVKTIGGGTTPPPSGGITLVNFGSSNGADTFDLAGWNILLRDVYTENRPLGPGGTTIVVGDNYAYNFQGVSGTPRSFVVDEKIVVTWYNNSASSITFIPGISFNDPDRRISGQTGVWYDMTPVTIQSNGTAQSQFVFAASTAGSYSLVNVNSNFQNNQILVCDKIVLVGASQPPTGVQLPAPSNVKVE